MSRANGPWTEAEIYKVVRALKYYGRQLRLMYVCEDWGGRSYFALEHIAGKLSDEDEYSISGTTEKLPLNVEIDPIGVYKKAKQYADNPSSRVVMPEYLAKLALEPEPEDNSEKKADPKEIAILERKIVALKDELSEAKKKLLYAHREESLFERLAGEIIRNVPPFPRSTVCIDVGKSREATPVDAVLLLSDEHADSVISRAGTWGLEQYDFNIFRCRMHRLIKTIEKFVTVHLPMHRFDKLWIFKLGDALQGDIHNASLRNHFQNTIKAALAVGDVESQMVQSLSKYFPGGVHVIGVSGNHTRQVINGAKKDYFDPHGNFDYLVMTQIATRLRDDIEPGRVSVIAPNSYTAYVEVRGRIWALNHGDEVRGFAGHPWYGFSRRNNRVQALVARKDMRVKYFCYGHYHTQVEMQEADAESIHAGNWTLTDQFAVNAIAAGSEPIQPLYIVDDKYGKIMSIPIYIRDDDAEESYMKGEWEPEIGQNLILDYVTPRIENDLTLIKR